VCLCDKRMRQGEPACAATHGSQATCVVLANRYLNAGSVQLLQGRPDVWKGRRLRKASEDVLHPRSSCITVHAARRQHLLQMVCRNLQQHAANESRKYLHGYNAYRAPDRLKTSGAPTSLKAANPPAAVAAMPSRRTEANHSFGSSSCVSPAARMRSATCLLRLGHFCGAAGALC
jgi:hypothetical protein